MTPRSASSPSALGGRQSLSRFSILRHQGQDLLQDVGVDPHPLLPAVQVSDSIADTLPRFSAAAARCRTGCSSASKPAGRRQRTSRPRALTLFTSQVQAQASCCPSPRAKPVIEAMVIGLSSSQRQATPA